MAIRVTLGCIFVHLSILYLVQSQNIDGRNHGTLQDMIDYAKQFERNRNPEPQQPSELGDSGKIEDDPVVRKLFQEFLAQYHQLTSDRQKEGITLMTTTPATASFIAQQTPSPEIRPVVQSRRRVSTRRKSNNPEVTRSRSTYLTTTTPSSPVLNRRNHAHRESAIETTTSSFPSLRQKYFSVGLTQTTPTRRPATKLSLVSQTTPAAPTITRRSVVVASKSTPKFQIAQNTGSKLASLPSKLPSKIEIAGEESESKFDEKESRRQAESATYEFASEIDDQISGSLHQREEVRDGLAVRGKYSYSDGYYMRTVYYEADDKGYRVVKEEVEPLQGPQTNPEGHAKVSSYVAGNTVNYEITQDDISKKDQKLVFSEVKGVEDYDEEK